MFPKPVRKEKEKKPYNSLQSRKKERKPLPEWKQHLFNHHESKPSKADRAEFTIAVVKAAIERSGGICEYCRQRPCTSTHHVVGRGRSGRGVLSNAFRACGICHMEIEGSEDKKQELISLYRQRYGDRFWFDERDWEEYNRKQAADLEVEHDKKARVDQLEPIMSLLSIAAGRELKAKETRLIGGMDDKQISIFAKLMQDVIGSGLNQIQNFD